MSEEPATVVTDFDSLEVFYPDGPRDCETIGVDPMTGTLVFVEKIPKGEARWYALQAGSMARTGTGELDV